MTIAAAVRIASSPALRAPSPPPGVEERDGERRRFDDFSSHFRHGLNEGVTVVVLANQSGRGVYTEEIARDVAALFQGKNWQADTSFL